MATALYVPCLAISAATGQYIPLKPMIIVLGIFVTTYTMMGGIKAVVWTDVTQFFIMFAGLTATIAIVLYQVPDGLDSIGQAALEVGQTPALEPVSADGGVWDHVRHYFSMPMPAVGFFVAMMVARLATYTSDQVMIQRFQTTRDIRDARKGFVLTAASDALWMTLLAVVGVALYAYFQTHALPTNISEHPDRILPYFMANVFPRGLTGLVIAAILAASLSSVDSAINSLCSVVMIDFYRRLYLGVAERDVQFDAVQKRQEVRISRIVTVLIGAVGITLSYNVDKFGTILEISNLIINSFTGAILGIFLLGIFVPSANSKGVFTGGFLGSLVTLYTIFWSSGVLDDTVIAGVSVRNLWPSGPAVSFLWPSTFGFLTTIIVGYIVSRITLDPPDKKETPTWFNVTRRALVE
jgi:SSS family transporter